MRRMFDFFRRAWELRRTRRELYALSDHMLRDIGLSRAAVFADCLGQMVDLRLGERILLDRPIHQH
mgnify:CR=1 FL=1